MLLLCSGWFGFGTRAYAQRAPAHLNISADALQYFNSAFDIIRQHSYKKKELDFKRIYQDALLLMKDAKDYPDTYRAIEYAVASLNDKHSTFNKPAGDDVVMADTATPDTAFHARIVHGEYAVLELRSFSPRQFDQQGLAADSLYAFLKDIHQKGIHSLIIDLRKMEGGANDPFLCGLAPLIKPSLLYYYVENDKQKVQIAFESGTLWRKYRKSKFASLYLKKYKEEGISDMKVAILTGPYTASAGEVIVIAFKGLPTVRSFGAPTYGVPTGVSIYPLKDKASIALANAVAYDRKNVPYTTSITPDVLLDLENTSEEQLFKVMQDWIK